MKTVYFNEIMSFMQKLLMAEPQLYAETIAKQLNSKILLITKIISWNSFWNVRSISSFTNLEFKIFVDYKITELGNFK